MVKHKETESESESALLTDEPCFRVSVCMKRFYDDERARALVCVSGRRRVRWLQRRLRTLFALPPRFLLLARGHLLPPDEPLTLLDRDDLVEVVPERRKIDDISNAPDVVDSIDLHPVEEFEVASPVPDDLIESKRRALLMLDQCYITAAEEPSEGVAKPRRRRVRRRRRACPIEPRQQSPSVANEGECSVTLPTDEEPLFENAPSIFRDSEVATVLRNDLQRRAPRVIRPLPDVNALTDVTDQTAVSSPADILTNTPTHASAGTQDTVALGNPRSPNNQEIFM